MSVCDLWIMCICVPVTSFCGCAFRPTCMCVMIVYVPEAYVDSARVYALLVMLMCCTIYLVVTVLCPEFLFLCFIVTYCPT